MVLVWIVVALLLVMVTLITIAVVLYHRADFLEPKIEIDVEAIAKHNRSTLNKNRFGLWEAHIVGEAVERGAIYGKLCSDLIKHQEDTFNSRKIGRASCRERVCLSV